MNWQLETIKPEPYKVVLLYLIGTNNNLTTGWWADKAGKSGAWIGLALNQSPPVYTLMEGSVTHWCEITLPAREGYEAMRRADAPRLPGLEGEQWTVNT